MYITINNIIDETRVDLAYPIKNLDSSKKVSFVGLFSDNIQYEFMTCWMTELEFRNKQIVAGTYRRRKLIDLVERKIGLTQFDQEPQISRKNLLAGTTEMVFNLDELDIDNTKNLKNGKHSNILFTYHLTAYEDSTHFEPYTPQYKKLKNSELILLA